MQMVDSLQTKETRRKPTDRIPGIDLLRGLCIIAVVVHHVNLRIPFKESTLGQMLGKQGNALLFWSGYYGVIVFFVISGFLITSWSLKRWGGLAQMNWKHFYAMRFARIVPCLVGVIVLLSVLHLLGADGFVIDPKRTDLFHALFAAATFHVNVLESNVGYLPGGWDVLWSLSVEEVFYIFFPLLCLWMKRPSLLIAVFLGFISIGPFARTMLTQNEYWADNGYLSCMDGIAFGCLAAMISNKLTVARTAWMQIVGTALCLLVVYFRHVTGSLGLYKTGLNVTVLELGTALLVIAAHQRLIAGKARTHWWSSPIRWFGRNSYEIYLSHMLIVLPFTLLYTEMSKPIETAVLWFIAIIAICSALGYTVMRYYSEPLNRMLRARLMKGKRQKDSSGELVFGLGSAE